MILILTQCFPPRLGGIETLMGGLADALAASGRSVHVLADGADPEASDAGRAYPVARFTSPKLVRRRFKAAAARSLLDAGVEAVIADSWKSLQPPLGPLVRRQSPGRILCLAHGMEFPASPSARKTARIWAAFDGAVIAANSTDTAERAAPYAPPAGRVVVIRPPIPPQPAVDPAAAAALAQRLGWRDGPLIATLARLEPRKGVDRLIAALELTAAEHPAARLAVAGDGADRARLEALAAERGVSDRVIFLGRVSDAEKAALFERADLFAMPARVEGDSVEGFGIVYLEAAWYGAPALAGRAGGAPDAVMDGETGLLCDGADATDVARTLGRLLSDQGLRARLGAAAAERARAQIWPLRVEDYLAALDL